ncbi:MAG: hypothetical protein JNM56_21930 [Planctomycetia bacterium]|nr:hypothetical protein [Planctomycetia bacterium]
MLTITDETLLAVLHRMVCNAKFDCDELVATELAGSPLAATVCNLVYDAWIQSEKSTKVPARWERLQRHRTITSLPELLRLIRPHVKKTPDWHQWTVEERTAFLTSTISPFMADRSLLELVANQPIVGDAEKLTDS